MQTRKTRDGDQRVELNRARSLHPSMLDQIPGHGSVSDPSPESQSPESQVHKPLWRL